MTTLRIAMWSGPRNISTALMRAWENRGDTAVWDEPLYAHYLAETGLDHPGKEKIIAAGERDWRLVVKQLIGPIPNHKPIFYQKHMTHHLLEHIDRSWMAEVANCFLIRDPREVLLSYIKTRPNVTVADVGIPQQADIFDYVCRIGGRAPLVIDGSEFLKDPRTQLTLICEALDIDFSERMLSWPPGPLSSDGVWAEYWYASVHTSTGFAPYRPRTEMLPDRLKPLLDECMPYYEKLYAHRLGTRL